MLCQLRCPLHYFYFLLAYALKYFIINYFLRGNNYRFFFMQGIRIYFLRRRKNVVIFKITL